MRKLFSRVDRQVAALIAVMLSISIMSVYAICMYISLHSTLDTLSSRVKSVYYAVDARLGLDDYSKFYTREQVESEEYQRARQVLQEIREIGEIRYLYTAGRNADGELIYMIDGLPLDENGEPENPEDYRYPGDLIEDEIQGYIERALNDEVIMPEGILGTNWGSVYVAYFPIHDHEGNVDAVLGLEYSAARELETFWQMAIVCLILGIVLIIISSLISVKIFQRISNPLYKDIRNIDFLTQLKNRNSFEVDFDNLRNRGQSEGVAICMIDLNDLKNMNDVYGHDAGDEYLECVGKVLSDIESETTSAYRYGGDEFIILTTDSHSVTSLYREIQTGFAKETADLPSKVSFAYGCAVFDSRLDETLMDTKQRADELMYEQKRRMKRRRGEE